MITHFQREKKSPIALVVQFGIYIFVPYIDASPQNYPLLPIDKIENVTIIDGRF